MLIEQQSAPPRVAPSEFRYWTRLQQPGVRRARRWLRRLTGVDPAPPDTVVRAFAGDYFVADPLCAAFCHNYRGFGAARAGSDAARALRRALLSPAHRGRRG